MPEVLDLRNINKEKLEEFAIKFPSYIGDLLGKVRKYIGTTQVTNETKERFAWNKTSLKGEIG